MRLRSGFGCSHPKRSEAQSRIADGAETETIIRAAKRLRSNGVNDGIDEAGCELRDDEARRGGYRIAVIGRVANKTGLCVLSILDLRIRAASNEL